MSGKNQRAKKRIHKNASEANTALNRPPEIAARLHSMPRSRRFRLLVTSVCLLVSLMLILRFLPSQTLEERRWFSFITRPPVHAIPDLPVDPNTLVRVRLDLEAPKPLGAELHGTVRAAILADPAANRPVQRFDILLCAFGFRKELEAAFSEEYVTLRIQARADQNAMIMSFCPEPLASVLSQDLGVHRLERFGYPFGRTLLEPRPIDIQADVIRGSRSFPFEKYEIFVAAGVLGHPDHLIHGFPRSVASPLPDGASYYPVDLHMRGEAGWAFQFSEQRYLPGSHVSGSEDYYITDEYVAIIVTRSLHQIAFVLFPLAGLLLAIPFLYSKTFASRIDVLVGAAMSLLLGILTLRPLVVPPELSSSGAFTYFDVVVVLVVIAVIVAVLRGARLAAQQER